MRTLLNMSLLCLVLCCAGCGFVGSLSKNDWLSQASQYAQDDGNTSFVMANVEENLSSRGGHCGHGRR